MQNLRARFGVILALSLLPIFLYALWLAFETGRTFPVFFAMLSLAFAYTAIWLSTNALVFAPLQKIQRTSNDFSTGDLTTRIGELPNAPPRITNLAKAFDSMADNISQRESAMLDNLVEKEVLLREIHHRVKNNLQIIISLPDSAIPVALFIVEALTNAIQHGVPNGGSVVIEVKRKDKELIVTVADDGPGHDSSSKQGTGLKLIKGFARQLSGRISTTNTNGHSVSLILTAPHEN